MAYATAAQMLERFDARMLGDLVDDTGSQVSSGDLLSDDNLAAALDDASGEIDAAIRASDRYTETELSSLSQTNKHLVRLTCVLALRNLVNRRPHMVRLDDKHEKMIERAEQSLEDLRSGKNILDINTHDDAGNPDIDGPTTLELNQLYTTRRQTKRVYPTSILPDGL